MRETAEVRRELGYPGMATPFSQLVGIQAVLNIVTGKRYSIVPGRGDPIRAGFYGETVAPIDPNVLDKIMAAPRAKQVAGAPPEQPTIEELRKRYGTDDDDELILRALVPEPDLEKMRAAGPVKRDFPLLSSPELDQVQRLMRIAKSPVVQIRSAALSLDLQPLGRGRRAPRAKSRHRRRRALAVRRVAARAARSTGVHPVDLYAAVAAGARAADGRRSGA